MGHELRGQPLDRGLDESQTGFEVLRRQFVGVMDMRPGGLTPQPEQRNLNSLSGIEAQELSGLPNLHGEKEIALGELEVFDVGRPVLAEVDTESMASLYGERMGGRPS